MFKFDMSRKPVVTEEDIRLGVLAAKAADLGLDVSGLNANEIAELLDPKPAWTEGIDLESEAVEVVNCRTVWAELTGTDDRPTEDEAADLLARAMELMPPSPIKEKARQAVDSYLAWQEIQVEVAPDVDVLIIDYLEHDEAAQEKIALTIGDDGEWSEEELGRWEVINTANASNNRYAYHHQSVAQKLFSEGLVASGKEEEVEQVEEVVISTFPLAVEVAKMMAKELTQYLSDLRVPGRSKATTKTAKQALLMSYINEVRGDEEEECGVTCHRCGQMFIPDEADYQKFLGSGKPFEPTDWLCLDCKAEELALWELQQGEAEVVADEAVPLDRLANEWWTPAKVAERLGTLVDPAGQDPYVYAPPLTQFVFKLGEIVQAFKSFNPAKWTGTPWQVRLAVVEERTGKPDLSVYS